MPIKRKIATNWFANIVKEPKHKTSRPIINPLRPRPVPALGHLLPISTMYIMHDTTIYEGIGFYTQAIITGIIGVPVTHPFTSLIPQPIHPVHTWYIYCGASKKNWHKKLLSHITTELLYIKSYYLIYPLLHMTMDKSQQGIILRKAGVISLAIYYLRHKKRSSVLSWVTSQVQIVYIRWK